MIEVINYLKDGTRVQDMTGHIVKVADAEPVYNLMDKINREGDYYAKQKSVKHR